MLNHILQYLLVFLTVTYTVANNIGVVSFSGGSRVVLIHVSKSLALVGFITGYVLEGHKMRIHVALNEMTLNTIYVLTITILAVLTHLGFITSVSQVITGLLLGYAIVNHHNYVIEKIQMFFISWGATAFSAILLSWLLMLIAISVKKKSLINYLLLTKVIICILTFLSAYVIGSNTVGFVAAFVDGGLELQLTVLLGIVVGVLSVKGAKGVRSLGMGLYGLRYSSATIPYISGLALAELLTQFGIPVPVSMAIFSGIVGCSFALKLKLLNTKLLFSHIVIGWALPPIISLILSYIIFTVIQLF